MATQLYRPEDVETPESREALCKRFQSAIRKAKKHWKKDFDRMIEDMEIAWRGAPKRWPADAYVVNITQRFVRQKVAALYAKNPRAVAKRRPQLYYQIWDENPQTLEAALMAVEAGRPTPQDMALVTEVMTSKQHMKMLDRLGKTLETLFHYYTNEQIPSFKAQMKSCVRSSVEAAVGYVKMGFQREQDLSPDNKAKIGDYTQRLKHIETLAARFQDEKSQLDELSAEAEELRLAIEAIRREPMVIVREGLVFDFPLPTSIIPDVNCTALKGWVGAEWLAEERFMTPNEITEFYGVICDTSSTYTHYSTDGRDYGRNPRTDLSENRADMACVWFFWHKPTGLRYVMLDGYKDFLEEPDLPEVALERFFPLYCLCFNEIIHHEKLFPPSDVRNMLPQQEEMNRCKQGLREHRKANRPGYVAAGGVLSDQEKALVSTHDANAVVELEGLAPGQKIADLLQEMPKQNIDPNLYETGSTMQDVYLSVGAQEANFGSTSDATATEASIAEANRSAALESEIDELNDFLTELARDSGTIMLMELDIDTVKSICGPGAVWPQMNRDQLMREVGLEIVAGSNGRPNRAMRQQAMQTLLPFLIQVPGINPHWLADRLVESIDDSLDLTEAYIEGLPSITAMNNVKQVDQGPVPQSAQGGKGSNNAVKGPAASGDSKKPGRPPMAFPVVAGGQVAQGGGPTR